MDEIMSHVNNDTGYENENDFFPIIANNNERKPKERKMNEYEVLESKGKKLDFIAISSSTENFIWPTTSMMRHNSFGLVYFI